MASAAIACVYTASPDTAALSPANLTRHYEPMSGETHATSYQPAALLALRRLFKPVPDPR